VLGTSHYRRVSNVSAGSPVGGRATSNLTISSSLTVLLSDIRRISLLRCCRLDSDRVEIEYIGAGNAVVAVPCIETPEP
jgi:hypothetical protein